LFWVGQGYLKDAATAGAIYKKRSDFLHFDQASVRTQRNGELHAHLQEDAHQHGTVVDDLMESESWLDWSNYPHFGAEPKPMDMNEGPSFQLMA
jgi:hypothetical protein